MKLEFAHWRVPSEARAFDGWLEGSPTAEQHAAVLAGVGCARKAWTPSEAAWKQLRDLGSFIDCRVRIQFWDPIMYLLEDEGPCAILADCRGIILGYHEGFLQAYLMLDHVQELPESFGYSPTKFLDTEKVAGLVLAPIAELFEIISGN